MAQKIEKSLTGSGAADPQTLREGREHLQFHLSYFSWLLEQRDWLAGKSFSLADIAGAANISCLDFLGEIKWRDWPELKRWYQTASTASLYGFGFLKCPPRNLQSCLALF